MSIEDDKFGCYDYSALEDLKAGQTLLKVPCRSPLTVVEAIKPYIAGKIVCELGSAVGDISLEMAKYSKMVIGLELDHERTIISQKRGVNTVRANAFTLPLSERVEVYYMWMQSIYTKQVFEAIKNGVVIMAGELGHGAEQVGYDRGKEVKVLDEIHAENPGSQMFELEYYEGDGDRESGTMVLLIVKK